MKYVIVLFVVLLVIAGAWWLRNMRALERPRARPALENDVPELTSVRTQGMDPGLLRVDGVERWEDGLPASGVAVILQALDAAYREQSLLVSRPEGFITQYLDGAHDTRGRVVTSLAAFCRAVLASGQSPSTAVPRLLAEARAGEDAATVHIGVIGSDGPSVDAIEGAAIKALTTIGDPPYGCMASGAHLEFNYEVEPDDPRVRTASIEARPALKSRSLAAVAVDLARIVEAISTGTRPESPAFASALLDGIADAVRTGNGAVVNRDLTTQQRDRIVAALEGR